LTFEEIGSVFAGLHIDFETIPSFTPEVSSYKAAHGFAKSGGVIGAVKYILRDEQLKAAPIANLDKKNIALLRGIAKTAKAPAPFLEVMACEGGCCTGPLIYNDPAAALKNLNAALAKME
ncbi:MAG: hydrogenase, partial [Bacteroidales bacterium]|nr:hydrogenase [Bacteroidales bacterium]